MPVDDKKKNQSDIANSLTIVLALKDRVPFTIRWMHYANSMHFPFKILIADGGTDERVPEIFSKKLNFPNLSYEYIRYPFDQTYTHFYTKLADALAHVETPFAVMADNDDFFVVDGLLRSVEFLRNHPDYSSCRGIIAGVRIRPNTKYGEFSYAYGDKKDISFAKMIYMPGSTLNDTASERVKDQFSCYRTNWYDVFRIEQLRENYRILRDLDTKDLILAQNIPMLLGYVVGKVYRGNFYYLVRQWDGPGSSDKTENREKGDHFDRMLLETWSADFKAFANAIASAISQKDGIPFDDAYRIVKKSYREFMAPAIIDCLSAQRQLSIASSLSRGIIEKLGTTGYLLRRQYLFIKRVITDQPKLLRFIPGHRLAASDNGIKLIYDFLTTPFESINK